MRNIQIERYEDLRLCNIVTDEFLDFDTEDIDNIRVMAPASEKMQFFWEEHGYFHADRMLKATINLKRVNEDVKKKIRLKVIKTHKYRDKILDIALKSFPVDRRFNVGKSCNPQIAEKVIRGWIDRIDEFFVCMFNSNVIGFAALRQEKNDIYEIHLAAVNEKYRMTGAAVSLYAALVWECRDMGGRQLYGWISSTNMAVLNLYCSLGAIFSEPCDIFLKEIK